MATRSRSRSLGTTAMAQREKRFDSDSDSDSARQPWFPPPPTAPIRVKKVRVRETPKPVEDMPPLPVIPQHLLVPPPPSPSISEAPRSPLMERVRSKRRTIMQAIEGWWDLDILEKRQTLFGGGGSRKAT